MRSNPFESFWMAGYECTDKLNAFGNRVDFLNQTGHLVQLKEDYHLLELFNIRTVREGIRWSQVEKTPYEYDWSVVEHMIRTGRELNIQQVWDLCHFGYPDDLTPLHPMFARRFAAMCRSFVRMFRNMAPGVPLIVTPMNEVSFISWLGGDVAGTSPYCRGYGWHVKYNLMRAYIEGIEALKSEDPDIRIMTTEPIIHITPGPNASEQDLLNCRQANEYQYQVLDMLSGAICPELRGKPEYLDILGINYYFNNQWCHQTNAIHDWRHTCSDSIPLGELIARFYERYNRPIVLAETSHPGIDRPDWIRDIALECSKVLKRNIPLWGVCWYPIIDRPDWDHMDPWHKAGIWDVVETNGGHLDRVLDMPSADALWKAQEQVALAMERTPLNELVRC